MKTFLRITLLLIVISVVTVTVAMAQRVIEGTVYIDGEPAAGITVEAHRGGNMMTSFDGKYKVEADAKSKWIKFTFIDDDKKLDIEGNASNTIDFAFSGKLPSEGDNAQGNGGVEVSLKSAEELLKEENREFMSEYTLYTEFYKQDEFQMALPHLKKLYANFPKSTVNLYLQGIKIYESFIQNSKTDEEMDKNIDKLMQTYDERIRYFGQKGYVMGRKAISWLKYKIGPERTNPLEGEAQKEALKVGYEWLMESVKEQGNETELPVLLLVMQTTKSLFKLGELTKENVINNYETCNSIINAVIAKNDNPDDVSNAKEIQPYIENIFGTSGAADCDALVNIFKPQFKEKGDDIDFIKGMLRRLGRAGCDESQLFSDATDKLYSLDPSAEAAFNMARRYLRKDDVEKAKGYYKQAMEQETDQELLASYYYEYGLFIFAKEKALSEARTYARKALAINPDYCEANMLIGDIYVEGTRSFSGSGLEKAAVFWVAVDYYNKARRGEDCAIEASQKAAMYKKYFPNKEEAFMDGLQEGKTYNVGGWINESTKIRF